MECTDKRENNGKTKTTINTDRVKELREKYDLTQEQFAGRVDISTQLVSKIERQDKGLSLDVALRIAKEFNVSLDWLFGLSDMAEDEASRIVYALENGLGFDFDNDVLKCTLNDDLVTLLYNINNAKNVAAEAKGTMPTVVLAQWIEGIKAEYNNKLIEKRKSGVKYNPSEIYTIGKLSKARGATGMGQGGGEFDTGRKGGANE